MSESFGHFDQRVLHLENALPSRVTLEEVYKRAGVTLRKYKQAKTNPFDLELRYGGGTDLETSTLRPGRKISVKMDFGRQVIEDFKPQGDICATKPGLAWYEKEEQRQEAVLEALRVAERHYHTLGINQIDGVRNMRGHNDAQVEQFRSSVYGPFFVAQAMEDIIREHREKVQAQFDAQNQREAERNEAVEKAQQRKAS